MNRKVIGILCAVLLVLSFGACKKKEEKPPIVPKTVQPGQQQIPSGQEEQQLPPGHQSLGPKVETPVVVPDSVKGKWKAVILIVEDKTANSKKEYTVNLNSELSIPGSNLKVAVGEFLPDFKMGASITSASNELNMPAVAFAVFEGDKQLFPETGRKWAWLYAKPEFQSIHPFEHPQYSIRLKEAVKKG